MIIDPEKKKEVKEWLLDEILDCSISANVLRGEKFEIHKRDNRYNKFATSFETYTVHCRYLEALGCVELMYMHLDGEVSAISVNALPYGYKVRLDGGFVGKYLTAKKKAHKDRMDKRVTWWISIGAVVISSLSLLHTILVNTKANRADGIIINANAMTNATTLDTNILRSASKSRTPIDTSAMTHSSTTDATTM